MKSKLLVCAAMFAALAATSPANAGIIINGTDYAVGSGTTLSFNGFSDGGLVPGLTADLTLTLTSIVGNTFNVAYSLLNTSTQTGARVVSFGFNVDPNVSGAAATGSFDTADLNVNYPVGFGTVEVCAYDGPGGTCTGNGNGATIGGGALTGNLALSFSSPHTSITLSNFVDRYQAFNYNGTNSAIGTPTTPLPEPSTWAMMLIGFGAIGAFMRRGKAADVKGRVSFA